MRLGQHEGAWCKGRGPEDLHVAVYGRAGAPAGDHSGKMCMGVVRGPWAWCSVMLGLLCEREGGLGSCTMGRPCVVFI